MLFISAEFVVFLGIVVPVFFLIPQRFKLPFLLLASLTFYGYSSPPYALLLLIVMFIDYGIARAIDHTEVQAERVRLLLLSLTINIGMLLLFKYVNFFNQMFAGFFHALHVDYQPAQVSLIVPLGISFFTFTKIAYVVDVYRKQIQPETSFVTFAAFVSFFPNLISGPIERAGHLIPQLKASVRFDEMRIVEGFRLILWGAFKKVVIADHLAQYIDPVYNQPQSYQGAVFITATFFLAFQIYADFSGYTDMARGIARILGMDLFENFRQPYLSKSILEFWRRWHITLTTWIREYLFFPLSRFLLRRTKRRYPRVIEVSVYLLVMGLVGLWHGASWTFIVWGLLHGFYMGAESLLNAYRIQLLPAKCRWANAIRIITLFLLVTFAWVFFRSTSLSNAGYIITHMFDFGGDFLASFGVYKANPESYITQLFICVALIVVLMGADLLDARRSLFERIANRSVVMRWAIYYALTGLILLALISIDVVPQFVYFKF